MNLFHRKPLALVRAAPTAEDIARESLRAALAARAQADARVKEAEAVIERTLGVIAATGPLDQAAKAAAERAVAATRAWATDGAVGEAPPEDDRELMDATTAASAAHIRAAGARDALPALRKRENEACTVRGFAQADVQRARGAVLLAQVEHRFVALAAAKAEYEAQCIALAGLQEVLSGRWKWPGLFELSSGTHGDAIAEQLRLNAIAPIGEDELQTSRDEWQARAEALDAEVLSD